MKKIFFLLLTAVLFSKPCLADDFKGGKVILDLQPDEIAEDRDQSEFEKVLNTGAAYFYDVKEYNELLQGDAVDKDLSEDIRAKYPQYNEQMVRQWQKYVKQGIKAYRFYEDIKKKIVDWIMNQNVPLVVADDQYEMGESEEYIETDKPLIIEDFKKVVAYSHSEKDRLAAKEKIARDYNLERPSERIAKAKKALLERDWKTLFDVGFGQLIENLSIKPDGKSDGQGTEIAAAILPRTQGFAAGEKIRGVIVFEPKKQGMILFSDYKNDKGITVDFTNSENIAEVATSFVLPQRIVIDKKEMLFGYGGRFDVYFEAVAKDNLKQVVLRPEARLNFCQNNTCKQVVLQPELLLEPMKKNKRTTFAAYVDTVALNVPRRSNAENFEFTELSVAKDDTGRPTVLQLNVKNDNAAKFKVFVIGHEAKYFAVPKITIDGDNITARFEILDPSFDPEDKEITFWVVSGLTNQYIHKMKVGKSLWPETGDKNTLPKALPRAFIGGLLLNLMPGALVLLLLKLKSLGDFGNINGHKIRRRFMNNAAGIITMFAVTAVVLSGLKAAGLDICWGMQYQNLYIVGLFIWCELLLLLHITGMTNLRPQIFNAKTLRNNVAAEKRFELLSGMAAVLLSVPFSAPFLATAFGVALGGTAVGIAATCLLTGLGMILPYVFIAFCPLSFLQKFVAANHLANLQKFCIWGILAALIWLIFLAAAQSAAAEIWHWILYLAAAFVLAAFCKVLKNEADKLDNIQTAGILRRRFNFFLGAVLGLLAVLSIWDTVNSAAPERPFEIDVMPENFEQEFVNKTLRRGGKVLLKIDADWSLTGKYNNLFVLKNNYIKDLLQRYKVTVVDINLNRCDTKILDFIQSFGRYELPFYAIFSAEFPNGKVLPRILNNRELQTLIEM